MIPRHGLQPRVPQLRRGRVRVRQAVLQVHQHLRVVVVVAHLNRGHQDGADAFRQVFHFDREACTGELTLFTVGRESMVGGTGSFHGFVAGRVAVDQGETFLEPGVVQADDVAEHLRDGYDDL